MFAATVACAWWAFESGRTGRRAGAGLVAVLALGLYVSPWPVFAGGLVAAAVGRYARRRRHALALGRRGATLAGVLAGACGLYAAWVYLDAVWLPHEAVEQHGGRVTVGYVLDSDDAFTTVLVSGSRAVVRLPSGSVVARTVCVRGGGEWALVPQDGASTWRVIANALPPDTGPQTPTCPR